MLPVEFSTVCKGCRPCCDSKPVGPHINEVRPGWGSRCSHNDMLTSRRLSLPRWPLWNQCSDSVWERSPGHWRGDASRPSPAPCLSPSLEEIGARLWSCREQEAGRSLTSDGNFPTSHSDRWCRALCTPGCWGGLLEFVICALEFQARIARRVRITYETNERRDKPLQRRAALWWGWGQ